MNPETAVKNLSLLRTVVGAAAWLTPNLAGKVAPAIAAVGMGLVALQDEGGPE